MSWVFTAYLLSASVGTPILGRLGGTYGKEKVAGTLAGPWLPALCWSHRRPRSGC